MLRCLIFLSGKMNLNQLKKARKIYHRIYHYVLLCYHQLRAYEGNVLYYNDYHNLHYNYRVNHIKDLWYHLQPQIIDDFNEIMNKLKPLEQEIRFIKTQIYNGPFTVSKLKIS